MDDYNPFIETFYEILKEQNNKKTNNFILNEQSKSNLNTEKKEIQNNLAEQFLNNEIEQNENEEIKSISNKNENNNLKNDEKLESSPISLLGKKRKSDNNLESIQISSFNNNNAINLNINNNNKNESIKEFTSISAINNENKILEEYDYSYRIILLNEGESGLIEDFFNEKQNESTTADFFNFDLDEEKWIKIVNHSILIHYERHMKELKEDLEKKKRAQNLYMNNMNNAAPNAQMVMNPMMFMNMANGVNYQSMYLQNMQNLKNMPK